MSYRSVSPHLTPSLEAGRCLLHIPDELIHGWCLGTPRGHFVCCVLRSSHGWLNSFNEDEWIISLESLIEFKTINLMCIYSVTGVHCGGVWENVLCHSLLCPVFEWLAASFLFLFSTHPPTRFGHWVGGPATEFILFSLYSFLNWFTVFLNWLAGKWGFFLPIVWYYFSSFAVACFWKKKGFSVALPLLFGSSFEEFCRALEWSKIQMGKNNK